MKLPTPRRPRVNLRYLLLEKGGGYINYIHTIRPSAQVLQTGTALCSSS